MTLVRRISTGELYEPSFDPESPFDSLFDGGDAYYFRHVIQSGKRWWQFWRPQWVRTGNIWQTNNEALFDVL